MFLVHIDGQVWLLDSAVKSKRYSKGLYRFGLLAEILTKDDLHSHDLNDQQQIDCEEK